MFDWKLPILLSRFTKEGCDAFLRTIGVVLREHYLTNMHTILLMNRKMVEKKFHELASPNNAAIASLRALYYTENLRKTWLGIHLPTLQRHRLGTGLLGSLGFPYHPSDKMDPANAMATLESLPFLNGDKGFPTMSDLGDAVLNSWNSSVILNIFENKANALGRQVEVPDVERKVDDDGDPALVVVNDVAHLVHGGRLTIFVDARKIFIGCFRVVLFSAYYLRKNLSCVGWHKYLTSSDAQEMIEQLTVERFFDNQAPFEETLECCYSDWSRINAVRRKITHVSADMSVDVLEEGQILSRILVLLPCLKACAWSFCPCVEDCNFPAQLMSLLPWYRRLLTSLDHRSDLSSTAHDEDRFGHLFVFLWREYPEQMRAYRDKRWGHLLSSKDFVTLLLSMFRDVCEQVSWNPTVFAKVVFDLLFSIKVCSTQSQLPRLDLIHEPKDYNDLLEMYRSWKMEQRRNLYRGKSNADVQRTRTLLGNLVNGSYLHRESVKDYSNFSKGKNKQSSLYQFTVYVNSAEFSDMSIHQLDEYNFGFERVGQEDTEGKTYADRRGWSVRNAYESETQILGELFYRIESRRENGSVIIERLKNLDYHVSKEVGKSVRFGRDQFNSTFVQNENLRREQESTVPRNVIRRPNRRNEKTKTKVDALQIALERLTDYHGKTVELMCLKHKRGRKIKEFVIKPTWETIQEMSLQANPPTVPFALPVPDMNDNNLISQEPFLRTQVPNLVVSRGIEFPDFEDEEDGGSSDYEVVVVPGPVHVEERDIFTFDDVKDELKEMYDLTMDGVRRDFKGWICTRARRSRRLNRKAGEVLFLCANIFLEAFVVSGMRAGKADDTEGVLVGWVGDMEIGSSFAAQTLLLLFGLHKFSNTVKVDMDERCRDIFIKAWNFLYEETEELAKKLECEPR